MCQGVNSEWQRRRSEVNHDWLKNEYFRHLNAFIKRLASPHPDPARLAEFINEDLRAWETRRRDVQWLLETFEQEMSPASLFRQLPLDRTDPNTKYWLPAFVHDMWKRRYPVNDWLREARAAFSEADHAYAQTKQSLERNGRELSSCLASLREQAVMFRDCCVKLNAAMSAFPSEIKVV